MGDDRGKDMTSAENLIKKHQGLEADVSDFSETIRKLGETAKSLIAEEHPER
jgi:spectrin beta